MLGGVEFRRHTGYRLLLGRPADNKRTGLRQALQIALPGQTACLQLVHQAAGHDGVIDVVVAPRISGTTDRCRPWLAVERIVIVDAECVPTQHRNVIALAGMNLGKKLAARPYLLASALIFGASEAGPMICP